jgi:hypothetical protein
VPCLVGKQIDASEKRGAIELRVETLSEIFNSLDPAPFSNRDLDPRAEEYIVSWARELPRDADLELRVHLERCAGLPDEESTLQDAIQGYFAGRSEVTRRRLKQNFRLGRISLLIGLAFLATALLASQLIERYLHPSGFVEILRESLLIGGWVAMWRPIEIFLYEWWPILADARLYDRLCRTPVRIKYAQDKPSEAWKQDWPAAYAQP